MIEVTGTNQILPHSSTAKIRAVESFEEHADSENCYSVCLYKEPLYKKIKPKASFDQLYIDPFKSNAVAEHLRKHQMSLNVFCDKESLEKGLSLKCGTVYLVDGKPSYPFFQHLYRYYSILVRNPKVKAYHFRGMDNIISSDGAVARIKDFAESGMDILNMPYFRTYTQAYCPIRGSCSVGANGINSLASFFKSNRFSPNDSEEKLLWHSDEDFLSMWFNLVKSRLNIYTIIDRDMPMQFYMDMATMIQANNKFIIKRADRRDI